MKQDQLARPPVATKGVTDFIGHTWRRFIGRKPGPAPQAAPPTALGLEGERRQAREEYDQLLQAFSEKTSGPAYDDIRDHFWYHTIDLGNGLVTPGSYDYRSCLDVFGFPRDMRGQRVLDVGSATGFFAFEFERRGAHVVSVELPSYDLDCFPGETIEQTRRKHLDLLGYHTHLSAEWRDRILAGCGDAEMYRRYLDGPFRFCHQALRSRVERRYASIYNLSPETLGKDPFDLVYLGDVLFHTINPLQALAAAAARCRGTLIISQLIPETPADCPAMLYTGGEEAGKDAISWWLPNRRCFEEMLRKMGFKQVEVVGTNIGFVRPSCHSYARTVLHARR